MTATALVAGGVFGVGMATAESGRELPEACSRRSQRPTKIATAKLIIEYNATDDDIGVHGAFDDDGGPSSACATLAGGPLRCSTREAT
ncbi:MAG: hypothetical protein WKF43_04770 [Acidimicrobiales bacterium]